MNKIIYFLLIIFLAIPIYSNNFIAHSTSSNFSNSSALPVFATLQNDKSLYRIKTKLENNPKAQVLLNELKQYVIVNSIDYTSELIPIKKISIDTIASADFSDKTQVNFQYWDLSKQWYLNTCNIPSAWKIATGKGIVVAVLDTGIDYDNNDFIEQLWINDAEDINHNGRYDAWAYTEERDGILGDIDGIDNDGNGYIDDVIGFDFVNELVPTFGDVKNTDGNPYDEHGHGTQVATVIGSKHSSSEVVGIAYDAKIMAVRTHNASGQSDCIAIANGIIYAVLNGANVINLSSGETDDSPLIHTAIKFAVEMGVVIVCSAGNDGNALPHYPSDYSEVISVGGINENQQRVFNYGDFLDITAPAVNIYVGNRNNTYRKNNGTSFSAPIVSAVCALLLSNNSNLSPAEIKTQIQLAAKSDNGWTPQFGAGIIDAKKTLDFMGKAVLRIEYPNRKQIVDIINQSELSIKGTIAIPLFDNYIVRIKNCRENESCEWDTLIESHYLQVISDELLKINLKEKNLHIGENIISVVCKLKSGKTIEERVNIFVINSNINLVKDIKSFRAYYDGNIVNIINAKTSIPTTAKLICKIENTNDSAYKYINSVNYITTNHIFILDNLLSNTNYNASIILQYGDIVWNEPIQLTADNIQISDITSAQMVKQKYSLPIGYLHKEPTIKKGQECLISSLFDENGMPNKIKYFRATQDSIFAVDSTTYNGICVSIKDNYVLSNNYGYIFLCNDTNHTAIGIGEQNSLDSSFIGVDLINVDGNDTKDIIYRDNNGNFYAAFINGNEVSRKKIFNYYALVKQNSDINLLSSHNQIATCFGNFYDDNKQYLAIVSSNDAYLSIVEVGTNTSELKDIKPLTNHYHNELMHTNHNLNQDIFIRNGDIDGDGIDELIYMYYGKIDDTSDVLGSNEVWTVCVYKSINDSLIEIASENILGVRVGNNYVNGLNIGDMDNDGANEILICTYPNLYIFKWNNEHKRLVPFWYYPECNSNVAVIGDFNGNSKNEICFNDFTKTIFFEFEKNKPQSVFNFKGHSYNKNSAMFSWESYADTLQKYKLLLIESDSLQANSNIYKKYTTNKKSIDINDLIPYTYYTAFVLNINDSILYNSIEIFTNDATYPINADVINNRIIKIKFSNRISLDNNSNGIQIVSENNSILSAINLTAQNDSSLIVEFEKAILNGNYKLKIPVLTDIYGNLTIKKELDINVDIYFIPELFLASLLYEPPLSLIVKFSENIDSTALIENNYTIYPTGNIENISFIDNNTIKILLSQNTKIDGRGKDYLLTAYSNIIAKSGNKMTDGPGNTLGFSIVENNLDNIYVYPAPISLSKHTEAYIAHLPNNVNIEILNQLGKVIKILNETDGNGGIDWDLTDNQGDKCAVGIYFIRAYDNNSAEQNLIKFAITK